MIGRYVDLHKFCNLIRKKKHGLNAIDFIFECLENSVDPDVNLERHGYWIKECEVLMYCSICGCYERDCIEHPYCPQCGSKMFEKKGE